MMEANTIQTVIVMRSLSTTRTQRRRQAAVLRIAIFLSAVAAAAFFLQVLRSLFTAIPTAEAQPVLQSTEGTASPDDLNQAGFLSGLVVCIDPGHGYSDAGTSSELLGGMCEKEINLAVALKLQALLQQAGCTVLMTRQSDEPSENTLVTTDGGFFLTQAARVAYANEVHPDLFLSLHCDSYEDDASVRGVRLYYCEATEYDSAGFCSKLRSALAQTLREEIITEASGYSTAYQVNRDVTAPSVLTELGFITNPDDAARLLDENWQEQIAQALFEGIAAYCEETDSSVF